MTERSESAEYWTDPTTSETYDLSAPWRDADGEFWHHVGWLALPGEPYVPLMPWSATRDLPGGGIRRMSDLATLRSVIDDCGPLTPAPHTDPDPSNPTGDAR